MMYCITIKKTGRHVITTSLKEAAKEAGVTESYLVDWMSRKKLNTVVTGDAKIEKGRKYNITKTQFES